MAATKPPRRSRGDISASLAAEEATITAAMTAKIEGSGLTRSHAAQLRFRACTREQCAQLGLPAVAGGFLIPYFDIHGRPSTFYRYRYLEDTRKGFDALTTKKSLRYGQSHGTVNEVYMPPLLDWAAIAADATVPLVITEGELKAACASSLGIPTLGLGGVWCFQSSRAGDALLPIFDAFTLVDRDVTICYDSDAATNPNVVAAEVRLAARLTERGAIVRIARIPTNEDIVAKMGLDDYLQLYDVDSFRECVLDAAFPYAQCEALHALSERVVYVRNPGLVWDHLAEMRINPQAFTAHAFSNLWYFEKRISPKGVETLVKVPTAKSWLEWEYRAEVAGITFAPGQPRITSPTNLLNTWTGWGLDEPTDGDITPWTALLDHLLYGATAADRLWFEQWLAYPLQHPGAKLTSAVLLWGVEEGTGKTMLGQTIAKIYGRGAAELKDADLEDDRNEWAENKQFIIFDDITGQDSRKLANRLKTMTSQTTIRLNPKYVPSFSVPDCINYYMTSNDPDALMLSDNNRRNFVHEVRSERIDRSFLKTFLQWRDKDGGVAALWGHLLRLDLTGFDPTAPAPDTASKRDMIDIVKSELGVWVRELRDNPEYVMGNRVLGDLATAQELMAVYDPNGMKRTTCNALARELKRAGFKPPSVGSSAKLKVGNRQVTVYAVRNTAYWHDLRRTWREACDHYGARHPELFKQFDKPSKF